MMNLIVVTSILFSNPFFLFPQRLHQETFVKNQNAADIINQKSIAKEDEFVLAKTRESFKLSDLYLLETKLESKARHWTPPNLLGIDVNTGSYLLKLDKNIALSKGRDSNNQENQFNDLSCINRYDWITREVLAMGTSGVNLVEDVIAHFKSASPVNGLDDFTLDYVCFGPMKEKDYTSKNLICRLVQCIPARAALSSKEAKAKLVLIETPSRIYLAQRIDLNSKENEVMKRWPNRPYQYSSAINPKIALIVVDILCDLTSMRLGHKSFKNVCMLDATCGSGTFLAYAIEKGMNVVGNDIKDKCVEGTIRNMKYLFEPESIEAEWRVENQDFSSTKYDGDAAKYQCAVTNLPWGQNRNKILESSFYKIM